VWAEALKIRRDPLVVAGEEIVNENLEIPKFGEFTLFD